MVNRVFAGGFMGVMNGNFTWLLTRFFTCDKLKMLFKGKSIFQNEFKLYKNSTRKKGVNPGVYGGRAWGVAAHLRPN